MTADKIIILARKHLGGPMESSARLALSYAIGAMNRGFCQTARVRALASLRYSIGILHRDYARAASTKGKLDADTAALLTPSLPTGFIDNDQDGLS